jgi:excisionase family DNA binding protein
MPTEFKRKNKKTLPKASPEGSKTSAKNDGAKTAETPVIDADITIYTLDEVATILKVTRRTVYKYIDSRELKAVKLGKDWRVKYSDLRKFIQALEYPQKGK